MMRKEDEIEEDTCYKNIVFRSTLLKSTYSK